MKIARIYKITCARTYKIYIGFTTKSVNRRFTEHKNSSKKQEYKSKLHSAMRKYGVNTFTVEEIYCSKDIEHCFYIMEKFFISEFDSVNSGYNITYGSVGPIGIVRSKRHKQAIRNYMKHRVVSDLTKNKMSIAAKQRCERQPTAFSKAAKNYIVTINGKTEMVHNLKEYARKQNISRSILGYAFKYNKQHHGYLVRAA